jgi:hypothetical protein
VLGASLVRDVVIVDEGGHPSDCAPFRSCCVVYTLRGVSDGSRIEDNTIWRHRGRKHARTLAALSRATQGWPLNKRGTHRIDMYRKPARLVNGALI